MDALRGTPRGGSDVVEERNSETDLERDQEDPPDQILGGEELTEHQEIRYASEVEAGSSTREIREPFSWGAFDQNGISTDPRVPFSFEERAIFPPPLRSPSMVSRERVAPSSSVHESSHVGGIRSVRKSMGDPRNVTTRDSRRPKERERDKEYRRSTLLPNELPITLSTGSPGTMVVGRGERSPLQSVHSPAPSVPSPGLGPGTASRNHRVFQILLIYNGQTVGHQVYDSMPILTLMEEAGAIYGLDPAWIILMLFSLTPVTLRRDGLVSGPPRVEAGATVFVFEVVIPGQRLQGNLVPIPPSQRALAQPQSPPVTTMVNSKLLAAFKLPKFDGSPRHWKAWDRSLQRFLGLHSLDYVLQEGFMDLLPNPDAVNANKLVYFLIEEAVAAGTLAAKYIRQAPKWSGHEAYENLYNRFVYSGPQTATILLAELSKIRLLRDETPSEFCVRLVELLEELETVPGTASVSMNDTQKLGYLLSAIRHESSLQSVYTQLQKDQLRGDVTFEEACDQLHHRCDAIRADEYLDSAFHGERRALASAGPQVLVSTEITKHHKEAATRLPCLAKDCAGMIVSFLPLCKGCYLQITSGKMPSIILRDGLGTATYDTKVQRIAFPPSVPASRVPAPGKRREKKKGLVAFVHSPPCPAEGAPVRCLMSGPGDWNRVRFFMDSGAGQCLCCSSSSFSDMSPCYVVVTGVSGSLQVHGCGTAHFIARDVDDAEVILRVHNCLFCYGDFNLISVSQFQQISGNAVDFSLAAPCMTVFSSGSARRPIRLPLLLDEGLFALDAEPFQLDDHRYSSLPKCDVTPNGNFVPCHSAPDSPWTQKVLAATTVSARILAASVDIGDNLKDFCNGFIAPAAIPPSRRQYDVGSRDDMIQLGIRFFGIGPDRLHHTVEIANGLAAPPSKVAVRDPPIHKLFPQGRLKEGKTPFVSKGRVGNLKYAKLRKLSAQTLSKQVIQGSNIVRFSTTLFLVGDGFSPCVPRRKSAWPSQLSAAKTGFHLSYYAITPVKMSAGPS